MKSSLKRVSILIFVILMSFITANASDDSEDKKPPKFYAGGNLGLQFGTITLVDVSPWISYRIIPQISFGIGGTYKYYRYNLLDTKIKRSYYGGRGFMRFYPQSKSVGVLNQFFLHAEYEVLKMSLDAGNSDVPNQLVESIFAGVGYQVPLGEYAYGDIYLLYDFNQDAYSPYKNPLLRVGVAIGL